MKDDLNLNNIYSDFFPSETKEKEEERKIKEMDSIKSSIENLYIDEESLSTLNKIIDYIKNYHDNINSNYINFNIVINSDNKEQTNEIISLISKMALNYNYIDGVNIVTFSLYNLEKTDVSSLYSDSYGAISLIDLKAILMQDETFKKKFLHSLKEGLNKKKITFLIGTKDETKEFLNLDEELTNKYFNFQINVIDPDEQDIYNEIINKDCAFKDNDNFRIELLNYIANTYKKRRVDYITYRDKLCLELSFNKKVPSLEQVKTKEEVFKELNDLVGLKKVKDKLNELVDLITLKNKTKEDLKLKNINLHMIFLGNPGTGKTTVARLIANILYDLKYIRTNNLVEVTSKDLVAEYVGQTAPKTMQVVEKALGGILFIDEAYALENKDGKNSYNAEAIATLIKEMEDKRDDLVVIFAGYTKEMQDFLDSNSGITSRIGYTFEFDDYTNEELKQMFENEAKKSGFELEDGIFANQDNEISVLVKNNGTEEVNGLSFYFGDEKQNIIHKDVSLQSGEEKFVQLTYSAPDNISNSTLEVHLDGDDANVDNKYASIDIGQYIIELSDKFNNKSAYLCVCSI